MKPNYNLLMTAVTYVVKGQIVVRLSGRVPVVYGDSHTLILIGTLIGSVRSKTWLYEHRTPEGSHHSNMIYTERKATSGRLLTNS